MQLSVKSNSAGLEFESDVESFRKQIRSWIASNCPESMKTPFIMAEAPMGGIGAKWPNPDTKIWLDRAAAVGLTLPKMPKGYGGAELTDEQAQIYYDELEKIGARIPLAGIGPMMLAPTIYECGNEEQKQRFIPPMASGEIRWAQGFSEPGAGSDLASLQLRAELDGEEYVLNGQKIWNSHADVADWMIVLVRTNRDNSKPRQFGISFLLVDLTSPGISIQPMKMINGDAPFCETFFDNVRVPVANRIGAEDQGWGVVKAFLIHERFVTRYWPREEHEIALAPRWAEHGHARTDLWGKVADNELDELGLELLLSDIDRLETEGADTSKYSEVLKCFEAEHKKRRFELLMLLLGERSLSFSGNLNSASDQLLVEESLHARAYSIGGGTTEVVRNVIAKRILHLPTSGTRA